MFKWGFLSVCVQAGFPALDVVVLTWILSGLSDSNNLLDWISDNINQQTYPFSCTNFSLWEISYKSISHSTEDKKIVSRREGNNFIGKGFTVYCQTRILNKMNLI